MRRPLPAALIGAATVVLAVPAAAAAAPSTWAGWESVGPAPRVGAVGSLAANGGTTATLGSTQDGQLRFAIRSSSGDRSGVVPPQLDVKGEPQGFNDNSGSVQATLASPSRLLVARGCFVRRTDDLGARWTSTTLPECTTSSTAPTLTFADADHGFALSGSTTWATSDGGASWSRRSTTPPDVRNGAVALSATVVLRSVGASTTGTAPGSTDASRGALQRSDDGGRTWATVPLPVTAGTPAPAPADGGLGGLLGGGTGGGTGTAPRTAADLPGLGRPVRRADGAVIVGAQGAVLRSTDGGRTFSRTTIPALNGLPGEAKPVPEQIVCDPSSRCVVGVAAASSSSGTSSSSSSTRTAVRFDGAAFGAELPALPLLDAAAPQPGVVVGRDGSTTNSNYGSTTSTGAIRRSGDLGASYTSIDDGVVRTGSLGTHGLLAVQVGPTITVSRDRGRTFQQVPAPPRTLTVVRLGATGGGFVALTDDGHVRRFAGGAWSDMADLSAIKPLDLAVAGDVPIVVGSKGVVRVTGSGASKPVSSRALAGRAFSDVSAAGRTVVAWRDRTVVRSTDGGARWSRVRTSIDFADVQVLSSRSIVGLSGSALFASTDGGRRFKRRGGAPRLGVVQDGTQNSDNAPDSGLEFTSARAGIVVTGDGAARTTSGGRRFQPLATPPNERPGLAVPTSGTGFIAQDPLTGTLYRTDGRTAAGPRLSIRRSGKPRRTSRAGARTQLATGTATGAPTGAVVALVTQVSSRTDATSGSRRVEPNADGSYRSRLRLDPKDRFVRAWYPGVVLTDRTIAASASRPARVPTLKALKKKRSSKRR